MQINYRGRDVIDVKRSRKTLVAGIFREYWGRKWNFHEPCRMRKPSSRGQRDISLAEGHRSRGWHGMFKAQ